MRAPVARMIVKVKRRSGAKKKMASPAGAPVAVRRRWPPAPAAGTAGDRVGASP
ncbi:MAG TPA: hypothetical protein VG370_03575 [Chloroflexota bacterium]|jgi:hypothetical protein|nr:hypothetical protein [Chloroflexota bacterium]